MRDLVIIGAGDFARETAWIAERMNEQSRQWNLLGFVDDTLAGESVDGYPVLGDVEWLLRSDRKLSAVCAIGTGAVREKIWNRLEQNPGIRPATLVDPAVTVGKDAQISPGCIVCAGTVLAIASRLGPHCIVNLNCTIGHDAVLEPFVTVHPGSNISGRVYLGARTQVGTGTKIIQGHTVAPNVTLGAGAVVVRDILEPGTYVGVPVKKISQ